MHLETGGKSGLNGSSTKQLMLDDGEDDTVSTEDAMQSCNENQMLACKGENVSCTYGLVSSDFMLT
jgi:hypothetical protein